MAELWGTSPIRGQPLRLFPVGAEVAAQGCARAESQLAEDGADVLLHRLGRQEQLAADLAIGETCRRQLGDLQLPRGQGRTVAVGAARVPALDSHSVPAGELRGAIQIPSGPQRVECREGRPQRFVGRLVGATAVDGFDAVLPTITGRAWITGTAQYLLDPDDPFPAGFEF